MTILDALDDPNLFAPFFQPAESWVAWRAALAATYALPMTAAELAVYQRHTGRTTAPTKPAREGGASSVAAAANHGSWRWSATYAAAFRTYALAPGERGTVMVIAADRRQARILFRYIARSSTAARCWRGWSPTARPSRCG